MDIVTTELVPFAFIFIILIFLLALPQKRKPKKIIRNNQKSNLQNNSFAKANNIEALRIAETKLIALKDLYKQDLIDASVYVSKTEVVAKNLSNEFGSDIMELPELQQKFIFDNLKKEINKKINTNDSKNVKNDIDNLIYAVDNKIKSGAYNENK
jgi:hypothetical protein